MTRVLVVDDDLILLKAINNILNKGGYDVSTAANGKEAMEKLETADYDLIITDIMMPYYNGLVVLSNIKSNPAKRHTKVIAISSAGNPEIRNEAINLGAEEFMAKPIIPNYLLEVVKRHTSYKLQDISLVTRKPQMRGN